MDVIKKISSLRQIIYSRISRMNKSHTNKFAMINSKFTANDEVFITSNKKSNDKGEYLQVIIEKDFDIQSAFLKIKLDTTTKPKAVVYSKLRINDNYIKFVKNLYESDYFSYLENYEINLDEFIDKNNKHHFNLIIISKPDMDIHNVFENMIEIINTVSVLSNESSVSGGIHNDQKQVVNPGKIDDINYPSISGNSPIEIKTIIQEVVKNVVDKHSIKQITEKDIKSNTNADTVIASDISSDISSEIVIEDKNIIHNSDNVSDNVTIPIANDIIPLNSQQLQNTQSLDYSYVESYSMPMHSLPLFNQITPAMLDAENKHILELEAYIGNLQRNLTIMKRTHEINVKCYNDKVEIHAKMLEEVQHKH